MGRGVLDAVKVLFHDSDRSCDTAANAGGAAVGGLVAAGAGVAANVQANLRDIASHNNVAVAPVVVV